MISRIEKIPITDSSYPFASAVKRCKLNENGYEESEYYFEGTSNVYKTGKNGKLEIKNANCPYVNRMIIRAPKNTTAFSGNVIVEIINPTSDMEIDRQWILLRKEIIRNGDIYVGFTSKPNTIKSLLSFNKGRYSRLAWLNPTPDIPFSFSMDEVYPIMAKDIDIKNETGLVWDMITDLAGLFREKSEKNPICGYAPKRIILSGWSQSANYLRRYVDSFDDVSKPYYDGYFPCGGVNYIETPINQYEHLPFGAVCTPRITRCIVPFISIQTESENANLGNFPFKMPDSDEPDFLYRSYEIAGASHDTMYSYVDYYAGDPDIERIAHMLFGPPKYRGSHENGNDYPMEYLFCAAYHNLFKWIVTGISPGSCEKILTNAKGENIRDGFGNSIGGLRSCMINYPTAHYCAYNDIGINGAAFAVNSTVDLSLFGYTKPFSAVILKELYATLENYRILVTEDTKRQVAKGFILKEDENDVIELAVKKAKERGLK